MSMTVHPRETRPHRSPRRDPPHDPGEAAQDARCWARLRGPARQATAEPFRAYNIPVVFSPHARDGWMLVSRAEVQAAYDAAHGIARG